MDAVARRLAAAGCVDADDEAHELVAFAADEETLEAWVRRREAGEPLAWIVGSMSFCGRRVLVDPGVYVPRLQTESLARRAASVLPAGGRAVDLCTGSGAVAVAVGASVPGASVVGVDIDPRAVACARRNGVRAVVGDAGAPPLRSSSFDVVMAVAPYVPTDRLGFLPADVRRYEPRAALDGGDDGLASVRRIVVAAVRLLRPGGRLLVEVGGDQDALLSPVLSSSGFASVASWCDDDGALRGVAAQLPVG